MLQVDAMTRADVPEDQRRDFCLYVDEFQNCATDSFATILSEARKYRLSLTIAHQYLDQLTDSSGRHPIRDAVFGNVGSMLAFQVGADDAEVWAEQFGEVASPTDLINLPRYCAYVRPMVDGLNTRVFSMRTIPPADVGNSDRLEIVRRLCRQRYARKRAWLEAEIARAFAFRDRSATTKTSIAA